MDENLIKFEMRLYALECLVSSHFAGFCFQAAPSAPLQFCETIRNQIVEEARRRTFPQTGPAMSDLLSAELEAAATRLVAMVSEKITQVLQARKGETS
jgi:hypothetical protein